MKLDRSLQLTILKALRDVYPSILETSKIVGYEKNEQFMSNMFYLEEHHLLGECAKSGRTMSNTLPVILTAKITAEGLDFLEDDGGLSAILNKITIKLDSDDLCKLLSIKVDQSDIPREKKNSILSTIKSLPSEALKKVYMHLVQGGLDSSPDAFLQLQTYLEKLI